MTRQEQAALKRRLEEKLSDVIGVRPEKENIVVDKSTDPSDDARAEGEMELNVQAVNADWDMRMAIEDALKRMRLGTYGQCESCDEPIGMKRLRALPWATLCLDCQSDRESDGNGEPRYDQVA